ncbi:hypothetical protein V2J09_012166 [Rumex salicifolius]
MLSVFNCCLSRNHMSEAEYKPYMDSAVSILQKQHPGASYMVFNFSKGHNNGQSLLSDILSKHEMTVVDYPLNYEGYPILPLEMIHYFLRSSSSWLSLEGQENVILLHCEQGGWPVLAFMLAGLLLYCKKCGDEQKTLDMVYNKAPMELLMQDSVVNSCSSQLRYLGYISNWTHLDDDPLVIDSLVLMNVPMLDGKGCRPVFMIYGQDSYMESERRPRLLFSSFSNGEAIRNYHEEECLVVKLDINRQVQGDVFLECIHLGEDLVTQETVFRAMFHTGFVESNVLILSLDKMDVVWDAKSKFPKEFKAEVHFVAFEEGQADVSNEVATEEEEEESYYESESEFFEVEEFNIYDSDDKWRASNLPPNYIIEELGDDVESGNGLWTQNTEIMFSVESFKELYLDDDDDEDDKDGGSYASSVENIVIINKHENTDAKAYGETTSNNKHVVVLAVSQEQDTELCAESADIANNSHISYDHEAYDNISVANYVRINKNMDSDSSEEGHEAESKPSNFAAADEIM